jgi:ribosomal protein S19
MNTLSFSIKYKKNISLFNNYKSLYFHKNIKDFIYYNYFSMQQCRKLMINKRTYRVPRNFCFKILELKYFIYKKFMIHNGKRFEYKRIFFDFLNQKVGCFVFTKKMGSNIHLIKKKKNKKKKK